MDGSTGTTRGLFATGRGFILPAVIWALYFAVVYAVQGAGCAGALDPADAAQSGPLRSVLLVLTLIAAVAIAAVGVWSWRTWLKVRPAAGRDSVSERSTFLAQGALLNAALFLVATLWVGLPILLLDPCEGHALW